MWLGFCVKPGGIPGRGLVPPGVASLLRARAEPRYVKREPPLRKNVFVFVGLPLVTMSQSLKSPIFCGVFPASCGIIIFYVGFFLTSGSSDVRGFWSSRVRPPPVGVLPPPPGFLTLCFTAALDPVRPPETVR